MKNIKLLAKLLLGYPLYFLSFLIPRNKHIWLFGSFGVFNDNSRYLYQYVLENPQFGLRPIWISSNKKSVAEAKKYGEAYCSYSLKGIYFCLIAKVYIFSSYISDIGFFASGNAIKVNLWHGIPLKKIEFDITTEPLVKIFRDATLWQKIENPAVHVKYDFVLSPSQYVADYSFKSAFRVKDENIIIAKYPRVSYLETCEPLPEYQQYHRVFLYAPTWRDDGRDFLAESKIDFSALNNLMAKFNSVFLIKLHPATKLDIDLSEYPFVEILPNNIDPIRLMKTADCLITDYSSIFFDYSVLNRPILYFCFDLDRYTLNREMYFSYDKVIKNKFMYLDFKNLFYQLEFLLAHNYFNATEYITNPFKYKFLNIFDKSDNNKYIIDNIFLG